MCKNILRSRLLLVLTALLAVAGIAIPPLVAPAPSAAQGGGAGFFCGAPPATIDGWVQVKVIMEDSGCYPEDAACWTDWVIATSPQAWYENKSARTPRYRDVGGTQPPSYYSPYTIVDPRDGCDVDCDGENELAAGTWYVNAVARPGLPHRERGEDGRWYIYCDWKLDYGRYYWFFGESDTCERCSCWDIEPTAAPVSTPAPRYTACIATPMPLSTLAPAPTVTPLPPPPQVAVSPYGYVRSPREAAGVWHKTTPNFFWLWQQQMGAKLWAEVQDPLPPAGCESASAEVLMYYIWGINGQRICPSPSAHPRTEPHPSNVLYPPEGWDNACVWRTLDEPVNLLWSKLPMQPSRKASWNQYSVTPFTQQWVPIDYTVRVWVTYVCNGFPQSVPLDYDLTLRVGLVKPVQPKK